MNKPPIIRQRDPSFENRSYAIIPAAVNGQVLLKANGPVTIIAMTVQLSAAASVQLCENNIGSPITTAFSLTANTIWGVPSRYLANNSSLLLVLSAGTANVEIIYTAGLHSDLLTSKENRFSTQSLGVGKKQFIESIVPLGASGIFTGDWHDTNLDGTNWASMVVRADQTGTVSIQETMDTADANQILPTQFSLASWVYNQMAVAANTTVCKSARIRCRYWRVIYTNGATPQTSFKLITEASPYPDDRWEFFINGTTVWTEKLTPISNAAIRQAITGPVGDINATFLADPTGVQRPFVVTPFMFCGSSAAVNIAGSKNQVPRQPNVIKTVSTAAAGATTIWTPSAGNSYRLLRFLVEVTGNAALAVAAVLTIQFNEVTTGLLPIAFDVFLPAAAAGNGVLFSSGWCDLGGWGQLAAAVNRALQINLSAALTAGVVRVTVAGCEE